MTDGLIRDAPDPTEGKKIVMKIDGSVNPKDVYATTYQMRNFYRQFADGFFNAGDVMNLIQHFVGARMAKKNMRVLDVCAGRCTMLPLLRYYAKDISEYVAVDICERNLKEATRKSGIKEIDGLGYYPFPVKLYVDDAAKMSRSVGPNSCDLIIYTAALEHMQKDAGQASLEECFKILKPGGVLFLTTPNTMKKKDPYDTQYAAHLYEWDMEETHTVLKDIGFNIEATHGLMGKIREFEPWLEENEPQVFKFYQRIKEYVPSHFITSVMAVPFPEASCEVAYICTKREAGQQASFGSFFREDEPASVAWDLGIEEGEGDGEV